jgi:hypothetical protein
MRSGSPTRAIAAAALFICAVLATGCERPPDEAWLRFLGFRDSGGASITVLEGNLSDGKTDYAVAAFNNTSVIVGSGNSGSGTGLLVKSARVDYRMSGSSPPSEEYPLNLYLGPSGHTNGTAAVTDTTEAETSFPVATASLKQWLISAHAAGSSSTVRLTADVTFFAETDEGVGLEVHGSIAILLAVSGGSEAGTDARTVSLLAQPAAATPAKPRKFTISRSGGTTADSTVIAAFRRTRPPAWSVLPRPRTPAKTPQESEMTTCRES